MDGPELSRNNRRAIVQRAPGRPATGMELGKKVIQPV